MIYGPRSNIALSALNHAFWAKLLIFTPETLYIGAVMKTPVYLDYNACAPPRPEVVAAMTAMMGAAHNASSVHTLGRAARAGVENAREKIAALACAPVGQVVFNSGATEGNNTVLRHCMDNFPDERILVSAIEHPSVIDCAPRAAHIPVTPEGLIDLAALEGLLAGGTKTCLVSVMYVNNETGVIQPMAEIVKLARKYGAMIHCDAVQAAGRIAIDMPALGVDFLTISAHKIGGPLGVGALVLGSCGQTPILLHGGGQEKKARAGTENTPGIVGFGVAAELALAELPQYQERLHQFRAPLEIELYKIDTRTVIYGSDAPRVANTTLFALPGQTSESLLMALDMDGIAVSNGSACSSGSVQPSHVLIAMKAGENAARGALRVSMGWNTSQSDLDAFLESWHKIVQRLEQKKAV